MSVEGDRRSDVNTFSNTIDVIAPPKPRKVAMVGKAGIHIRRVKPEELRQLVDIYRSAYTGLEEYAYTSRSEIRSYMRWLYRGDPHGFFVAELDGNIVGFVSVHTSWWDRRIGRTAEIHEVVVDKMYQRQGIGRLLIDRALQYARERGCNQASLWVGVANTTAREWYKRMGFKETGQGYDWVRMVKELKHLP